MTNRDILYVKTIYECGSITKAAEQLYIAQPSLTIALRDIENEYKVPFFYRERKGVRITQYGREFLNAAEEIYKMFQLMLCDLPQQPARIHFDTKTLRCFCLSAENQSYYKAAEILSVSRTSVYRRISKWEDDLGCKLLQNNLGQLELTHSGSICYKYATEILSANSDLVFLLVPMDAYDGELCVGMGSIRSQQYIPEILPKFHSRFPAVNLHLYELNTLDLSLALKTHQVDIIVTSRPLTKKDINYEVIRMDRLVMVAPKDDPFAKQVSYIKNGEKHVALAQFEGRKFITGRPGQNSWGLCEKLFKEVGYRPQVIFQSLNDYMVAKLAYDGLGYGLIPKGCAIADGVTLPYYYVDGNSDCEWAIGIATRKSELLSPAGECFVELLREAIMRQNLPDQQA